MSENAIDLTPQEIDSIKAQMIASDDALVMSEFFKALSDPQTEYGSCSAASQVALCQ